MDSIIKKLQELEREARALQEKEKEQVYSQLQTTPAGNVNDRQEVSSGWPSGSFNQEFPCTPVPLCPTRSKEAFEGDGDGDWWTAFRKKAGPWKGEKLVVLSLFDGIGGIWAALTRLGIPFVGYSSEVSPPAIQVVKARYPNVHHVGDVRKLDRTSFSGNVDLVVGGFPCQDLSAMGRREGLHGQRSKLFFDLLRVLKEFKPKWFLVENVASMTWIDREEISKYLRVHPIELDSIELTPTRRRRVYWTNIPYPPRLPRVKDHPSTFVQSSLQNAIALEEKTGVVMGFGSDKANSCLLEHVMDIETRKMRGITQIEVEVMMGYPPNHTNLLITEAKHQTNALVQTPSKMETSSALKKKQGKISGSRGSLSQNPITPAIRWALLGNTFTVPTIGYLISPLLKGSVRVLGQPVIIPGPTKENECSVMEPYDVWALYNEHERPNWYARILKRAGDRFSRMSYGAKKHPLYIEMQYLEITTPYLEGEDDEWNPLRGTGLFELREEVDTQVAWTTFSHRVTSCLKLGDKFYVYPGKDEVWAVYSRQTWSPFFVYVVESNINIKTLDSAKPGLEGFYASCRLMLRTAELGVYRKTEHVLEFTDLSLFCFRAPHIFRQEANLLKVEVSASGRKTKNIERGIRRSKESQELEDAEGREDVEGEEQEEQEEQNLVEETINRRITRNFERQLRSRKRKQRNLTEFQDNEVKKQGGREDQDGHADLAKKALECKHDSVDEELNDDVNRDSGQENGASTPETVVTDEDGLLHDM